MSSSRWMTAAADAFVAFGLTGDLGRRMTIPALYRLTGQGLLTCPVVGVGRRPVARDELERHVHEAVAAAEDAVDEGVLRELLGRLTYIGGDAEEGAGSPPDQMLKVRFGNRAQRRRRIRCLRTHHARPRYSPVLVSTLTTVPFSTKGGTLIFAPPSQIASLS